MRSRSIIFCIVSFTLLIVSAVISRPCPGDDIPELELLFTVQDAGRDVSLMKPGAIGVDTLRGEVYLTDRGRKAIYLYNDSGRFLQNFGKDLALHIPHHLHVDPSGNLVVGEQDLPKLWLLDLRGKVMEEILLNVEGETAILPGGMSHDTEKNIYVTNRYGRSVVSVNLSDQHVDLWYSHPEENEKNLELQDIISLKDGRTILLSSKGSVVHILDKERKPTVRFGRHGSLPDEFSFPSAFALGPKGNLWIVDAFQHSVKVFNLDGTFIHEYGEMGTAPGKFFFPVDIAFGKGGRLFILEKGIARFQIFKVGEGNSGAVK